MIYSPNLWNAAKCISFFKAIEKRRLTDTNSNMEATHKVLKPENEDYPYNVQIFYEINVEKYYTGSSRFCRTKEK